MPNTELSVVLKLVDQATSGIKEAVSKSTESLNTLGKNVAKVGADFNKAGKEISKFGTNLTLVGGTVTAFFVTSFKSAEKTSLDVSNQLKVLSSQFESLQREIAIAVIPIVDRLINVIGNLRDWLNSIPSPLREQMIQFTLLSAIVVSLSGVFLIFIGRVVSLIGTLQKFVGGILAINPALLAVIAIIGVLIVGMYKFRDATANVFNAMQALFISLKQGFFEIKSALEEFVASGLEKISLLYENLAKFPGPLKEAYQAAAIEALKAANSLRAMSNEDLVNAKIAALELKEIFKGEDGSWAVNIDNIRAKIQDLINFLPNLGKAVDGTVKTAAISFSTLVTGLQQGLSALSSSLSQAAASNKSFAEAARAVSLGLAIVTTAAGITRAFQDYAWPFSMVVASLIGAAGAIQIATIAAQKFHSGGMIQSSMARDEVPIIAQTGEGILSRKGMATLGGESRLNALNNGESLGSSGDIYVTVNYPKMTGKGEVEALANLLGYEIQKELRYSRGI